MRFLMNTRKVCGGLSAASLIAWLLLMPPFSVTPAGETFVDSGAPLFSWEVFSQHANDTECRKHRDELRVQLDKAVASTVPDTAKSDKSGKKRGSKARTKSQEVFATLKQRAAIARCVDSHDARLRKPAAAPTPK
jgi:hypothetical protein